MKKLVKSFLRSRDGVAAVEMAIIAPILFGATLMTANVAYMVWEHQRVANAAVAAMNYLQDQSLDGHYAGLAPSKSDAQGDGDLVATAKLILQDAYGKPIDLGEVSITASCGCPKKNSEMANGFDENKPFYQKTDVVSNGSDNICPTPCSDGDAARIVAEIDVSMTVTSLFGKDKTISERLVSRLR